MNPVELSPMTMRLPADPPAPQAAASAVQDVGAGSAASPRAATGLPSVEPAEAAVADSPAPGLASFLEQARATQAQLVSHPLPIANHNSLLIMKLLGG